MIEYFSAIDWSSVATMFGIFVVGMFIGTCLGFNAGRQLAIERITDHVNSKRKDKGNTPN